MSRTASSNDAKRKAKVLELLAENRVMTIATLRSDGWPQATMVGYVHDDLTLYFVVARNSQKFSNIKNDPRVSISLGHDLPDRLRGLSMAAHAVEVSDVAEIERLNSLVHRRYPEQSVFSPRHAVSAVFRATPTVISLIDVSRHSGDAELLLTRTNTNVQLATHRTSAAVRGGAKVRGGDKDEIKLSSIEARAPAFREGAPP